MKKHFYSHLVDTESIYLSLHELKMDEKEKRELMVVVESSVHHLVVDIVLSELSEPDKKSFLMRMAADKHDEVWNFLKRKTKDIEKKISEGVHKLKQELMNDIRESKKSSRKS